MHDDDADPDPTRRGLMRQAACVAGGWAASTTLPALATGPAQAYPRALLVDALGDPLKASALKPGEPLLFNYPYAASPVFLLALGAPVRASEQATGQQQPYAAPAGVGPQQSLVAFCAICPHKLVYPTAAISFIGVRKGQGSEPAQVIHCCGDDSRYDPAQGGRVLAGPAPQPLAAVLLEWDRTSDRLHAVGLRGGEVFKPFFEKYAFKLEMELGSAQARALVGATTVCKPASAYSRQWQSCKA
jgi:Rieske Fe-S protein